MQQGETRFVDASELPVLGDASPIMTDSSQSLRMSELSSSRVAGKRKLSPHVAGHSASSSSLSERLTMMNIPTQELKGPVYYGWLWKKGQSFKTWKKRFFLLNGCTLTYYTQCCVIASELLGGGTQCLDLPAKGGLRVKSAELCDATEFGVLVTSSSGRELYLQAGDHDARRHWVAVLQEAPKKKMAETMMRKTLASDLPHPLGRTSSSKRPGSPDDRGFDDTSISVDSSEDGEDEDYDLPADKEGYLDVRGSVMPAWNRRFVVLNNGHITVLRRRRAPKPQDKSFEVISVHGWVGHPAALVIRLQYNRDVVVRANSELEAQAWLEALRNSL